MTPSEFHTLLQTLNKLPRILSYKNNAESQIEIFLHENETYLVYFFKYGVIDISIGYLVDQDFITKHNPEHRREIQGSNFFVYHSLKGPSSLAFSPYQDGIFSLYLIHGKLIISKKEFLAHPEVICFRSKKDIKNKISNLK